LLLNYLGLEADLCQ